MSSLLPFFLLLSSLLALAYAVHSSPTVSFAAELTCPVKLRFTRPLPGEVVRTQGLHFEVEALSKFGTRIKSLADGTLCYKDRTTSWEHKRCLQQGMPYFSWNLGKPADRFFGDGAVTVDAAFFPNYTILPHQCRDILVESTGGLGPTGEGELVGSASFKYELGGRYDGAPKGFGVDPTVQMDLTLSDRRDVAGAVQAMACVVTDCSDHRSFIRQLMLLRGRHHPIVKDAAHLMRSTLPPLRNRHMIGDMLNADGGMRIGVEVGVQKGNHLEELLSSWGNAWVVFGVDPWIEQEHYLDQANLDLKGQSANMQETEAKISRFGAKGRLIRDLSVNAARLFPDETLDFVYLDARHDYGAVTEDLVAFWPKVRRGGIIAGHDFLDAEDVNRNIDGMDWSILSDGSRQPEGKAVKGAVIDFAAAVNRQVVVAYDDGEWPSWFMRK